jgi:biopolymer transport protein ExbB/TolQ
MTASIRDAGPFMWLLLTLSVVALAYILERAWALRRARVMPPALAEALADRDPAEVRTLCHANPSPLGHLALAVVDHLAWPKPRTPARWRSAPGRRSPRWSAASS